MDDKQTAFSVGDRVWLSPYGRRTMGHSRRPDKTGVVVKDDGRSVIQVLFEGAKTPRRIHRAFIELVPPFDAVVRLDDPLLTPQANEVRIDFSPQQFADALEAAFIAGFDAGQSRKPEEWLTAWTEYLTKGIANG